MASASVISLVSVRLVRVTVPVRDASVQWDASPAPQVVHFFIGLCWIRLGFIFRRSSG
jgi:hypothetical protein